MRIEDVVEALNMSIKERRNTEGIKSKAFLAIHKSIIPDDTFKAYKNFEYRLWYIDGKNKYAVLYDTKQYRVTNQTELEVYTDLFDKEFCAKLFEFVNDDLFLDVILGNYEAI